MKREFQGTTLGAVAVASICLLGAMFAFGQTRGGAGQGQAASRPGRGGQAAGAAAGRGAQAAGAPAQPAEKELMAEEVYKNVQVLKGIPANQFLATMGIMTSSLGVSCNTCHTSERDWQGYADDAGNRDKDTSRKMIRMVNSINQANFGGRRLVTCYSCHRGSLSPKVIPSLAQVYDPNPSFDEPDNIGQSNPGATPPAQILDKYIEAVGGAQRVAALNSFVAKGTFLGYPAQEGEERPVEIYVKGRQRTVVLEAADGDNVSVWDGEKGWVAEAGRPVPVVDLTGTFRDAAKVEADLSLPDQVKQALTNWRTGETVEIDGKDATLVFGTSPGRLPVKLYFDEQSGLLVRTVRFTDSPLGRSPYETDFSDYRDVNGVKMPFHMVISWLDGRSDITLTDVQTNVPVDASKFGKPAAPKVRTAR